MAGRRVLSWRRFGLAMQKGGQIRAVRGQGVEAGAEGDRAHGGQQGADQSAAAGGTDEAERQRKRFGGDHSTGHGEQRPFPGMGGDFLPDPGGHVERGPQVGGGAREVGAGFGQLPLQVRYGFR